MIFLTTNMKPFFSVKIFLMLKNVSSQSLRGWIGAFRMNGTVLKPLSYYSTLHCHASWISQVLHIDWKCPLPQHSLTFEQWCARDPCMQQHPPTIIRPTCDRYRTRAKHATHSVSWLSAAQHRRLFIYKAPDSISLWTVMQSVIFKVNWTKLLFWKWWLWSYVVETCVWLPPRQ